MKKLVVSLVFFASAVSAFAAIKEGKKNLVNNFSENVVFVLTPSGHESDVAAFVPKGQTRILSYHGDNGEISKVMVYKTQEVTNASVEHEPLLNTTDTFTMQEGGLKYKNK